MLIALVYFLVMLLVAGFLFWAIQQLLALVPVAEPFATIIRIVLYAIVLLIVIWFIFQIVGMVGSFDLPRLHR